MHPQFELRQMADYQNQMVKLVRRRTGAASSSWGRLEQGMLPKLLNKAGLPHGVIPPGPIKS